MNGMLFECEADDDDDVDTERQRNIKNTASPTPIFPQNIFKFQFSNVQTRTIVVPSIPHTHIDDNNNKNDDYTTTTSNIYTRTSSAPTRLLQHRMSPRRKP